MGPRGGSVRGRLGEAHFPLPFSPFVHLSAQYIHVGTSVPPSVEGGCCHSQCAAALHDVRITFESINKDRHEYGPPKANQLILPFVSCGEWRSLAQHFFTSSLEERDASTCSMTFLREERAAVGMLNLKSDIIELSSHIVGREYKSKMYTCYDFTLCARFNDIPDVVKSGF